MAKKKVFVNRTYFSSCYGPDVKCPFCGHVTGIENPDWAEDQSDDEIGKVCCPECSKYIIFQKSTTVVYTVLTDAVEGVEIDPDGV
jgi:ribosomal protein S27E